MPNASIHADDGNEKEKQELTKETSDGELYCSFQFYFDRWKPPESHNLISQIERSSS
jgi:hypothetical protein